jgi:cytochrome c-type biogenesis protein CcmH/NrfG
MIEAFDLPSDLAPATAGDIAVINLKSSRQQSWSRFWRAPERPGTAESIVEQEQLTAQFVGDLAAFDRLEILVNQLARTNPEAAQTSLIAAQVACATHRFAEATVSLAEAVARGVPSDATERLSLSLDQATGKDLYGVLAARRKRAAQPGRWEELVPLGALLADLCEFDEAERTYHQALREYQDVSPFALAWVCFQLGVLWGELVPETQSSRGAQWYGKAIEYLPCYVKARVHLAEICLDRGETGDARALLTPVLASGDPEVSWRLADVAQREGHSAEAEAQRRAARSGFEGLLARHLLAFADHAAEFYSGSGRDPARAVELARVNLANRPTLPAFKLAHATALAAGEPNVAELAADARKHWGGTLAFRFSPLAMQAAAADHGRSRGHADAGT